MRNHASAFLLLVLAGFIALAKAETIDGPTVVKYLTQTIGWYQRVDSVTRSAHAPETIAEEDSVLQTSRQIGSLAFQFARAQAEVIGNNAGPLSNAANVKTVEPGKSIEQTADSESDQAKALQANVDSLNEEISKSSGTQRDTLIAQRDEVLAHLNLTKVTQSSLQTLLSFMAGPGSGEGSAGGLLGQVNALNLVAPELTNKTAQAGNNAAPARPANTNGQAFRPESSGILGLVEKLISTTRDRMQLSDLLKSTKALQQTTDVLRDPARTTLRDLINQGNKIGKSVSSSSDTASLNSARNQLNSLAAQFKQQSAAITPLMEAGILLQTEMGTLNQWRNTVDENYRSSLHYLLLRLSFLAAWIIIILGLSEASRQATDRYIRETRRKRQFMLLRRFVLYFALTIVFALDFFSTSGFGSLATAAGFITAGLAVALQNVILSVVAYFFLIGRYGVRVGDRITVSGVTGEVIDVGLTRIYMLELAGAGFDLHSTGRVVVVSNAMLFQPSAWFKQAPGTDYTWHTVSTTLDPSTDFEAAKNRLMAVVDSIYESYKDVIEEQHRAFEQSTSLETSTPRPEARVRYNDAGLEVWIRYPVELQNGPEIDDQITRGLISEVEKEPKLKLTAAGVPKILGAT